MMPKATFALLCFGLLSATPLLGQVVDPDHVLTLEDVAGVAGDVVVSRVLYDNPEDNVVGWSTAVCHDTATLEIIDVADGETTETVWYGLPPAFNGVAILDGAYTQGVVVCFFDNSSLAPGVDRELTIVTYQVLDAAPEGITSLDFCEAGQPTVTNTIVEFNGGISVVPTTNSATVVIGELQFRRGDVDANGAVSFVDPLVLLEYLFADGATPSCLDAADIDDDATVNLIDPLALLGWLFIAGTPPPATPGPDGCGIDPTSDSLPSCSDPNCP